MAYFCEWKMPPRYSFICSVPGCGRKFQAKGLCRVHYFRMRAHGSLDLPPPKTKKHGHAWHNGCSRVYRSWADMRRRCSDPKCRSYYRYGALGITYDPRYEDFREFIADVGEPPSEKHTIDRIDNSKGYFKENMRWALPSEQARNRRSNVWVTVDGARMIMKDACAKLNIDECSVAWRVRRYNLTPQEALERLLSGE